MKKLALWFLAAMTIIAVGCEKFDDSAIWDKLNSLESRIVTLEQLCAQMNTNISSLQTIVAALQNNDYVTNIAPITEDGKIIGYTITFSKSGSVTIYHGKDGQNGTNGTNGKDGSTPVIGVKKDSNGIYYWTINGEWLLDNDGNKIKAQGTDGKDGKDGIDGKDGVDGKDGADGKDGVDGKDGENGADGKDGITPKLKIENGYWKVSYDGGKTWEGLGKATGEDGADGEDGDSMFVNVTYDDDYVYITLADGTELIIPRYNNNDNNANIPNSQIWYTSTDGKIVTYFNSNVLDESYVFGANIISNNVYENGRGIITFDREITSIGNNAFYGCRNLKSITIPNSVTSIGEAVFHSCSSLTSITIPDSVTGIDDDTFGSCSSLKSITIPDRVTFIGYMAFDGCSSLKSVYCKSTTPPSLGYSAFFDNASDRKFYVPVTSVDKYKTANNWKDHADNIVGYDFTE